MNKQEKVLKQYLIGKTLNDIEFYDSDGKYLSADIEHTWFIDAAVQMKLNDNYFSFGFIPEYECYDILFQKYKNVTKYDFMGLGAKDVQNISSLLKKKISGLELKWNFYYELDENFENNGEKKYMPVELLIHFENRSFLQVASINYEIYNKEFKDIRYDSQSSLLISANKLINIEELEE